MSGVDLALYIFIGAVVVVGVVGIIIVIRKED